MNNLNLILSNEPKKKAAFITDDGHFINLQDNKVNMFGYADREVTHYDFFNYLTKNRLVEISNPYDVCDQLNLIRINDGTYIYLAEEAFVDLPKDEPTKEQYSALLKWFDFLMLNSKKDFIYIGFTTRGVKFRFINKVHTEGLLPEDLVKEVRRMYKEKKV